jgi:outer membrane protein
MKKRLFQAGMLLGLLLLAAPVFAQRITNVGLVDLVTVYNAYYKESAAVKDLEQKRNEVLRELDRIDAQIRDLESRKVDAEGRGDTATALDLDRQIFERKSYRSDYQRIKMEQIRKLAASLSNSDEFLAELQEVIKYVAESEGFSIILNISGQAGSNLMFYTKEVDITGKVIEELNRRASSR